MAGGFEYRSKWTLLGWPLVHISFKYRPNRLPDPARAIISIDRSGMGVIKISQFGVGILSLSQFTISIGVTAQMGVAYWLVAQVGIFVDYGYGQVVRRLSELLGAG